MRKYDILDIFSYVSKKIIDLKELEYIFKSGIDNSEYCFNDYNVKRYEINDELDEELDEYIIMAVNDLKNEGKRIAFICDKNRIIAVIGYRET